MSAPQTTSSTSPTPATSRPSKTQNSLLSNPPSAFNENCLERVTKKIVKFQTDLEAAEANLVDKRRYLQEAEAASEQAKVNFRNLGRNTQLSDFDILDGRKPEEWTPAALERQANEIEKLAQLKREALFALSELVDKERLAGADLKRAEEWLKKCKERMEKLTQLMDLTRELDED
jgi:DNA repair ATPase RecN